MKRSISIYFTLSLCTLASAWGAEGPLLAPILTDNSPGNLVITWRSDTGTPGKFGPGLQGLRWEFKGTTRRGLELNFAGAYIPELNDIRVVRLASTPGREQLAQWQFAVSNSLQRGQEHPAPRGGVSKEPVSDGLLPGFRTVTFTLKPDAEGPGWTASLKWSNPDVGAP